MTIHHFVAAMRRGWVLILICAAIGTVLGAVVSISRAVEYNSTVTVLMSADASNAAELAQGASYVNDQMASYIALLDTTAVLDPATQAAGGNVTMAESAAVQISANVPVGSTLMHITVTSDDPDGAARLANELPGALQSAIAGPVPSNERGDPFVRVVEVQPAAPPSGPANPGIMRSGQMGLLIGLILGVLLAIFRYVSKARESLSTKDGWQ